MYISNKQRPIPDAVTLEKVMDYTASVVEFTPTPEQMFYWFGILV